MSNQENKEQYILLDNLFNLFLDMKYQEDDYEQLKESGIVIDQIVQKNVMLFRQLKTQAIAELNSAKHNRVMAFISKIKSNAEEVRKLSDEIFAKPKFAELQPMFRNLDKISEEDKQSILLDSKLLDLLGEIEEEYNKDENNE